MGAWSGGVHIGLDPPPPIIKLIKKRKTECNTKRPEPPLYQKKKKIREKMPVILMLIAHKACSMSLHSLPLNTGGRADGRGTSSLVALIPARLTGSRDMKPAEGEEQGWG